MRLGVKVCGLTRPADVEAALEAGVDAFGVVFDRGPCRVSPDEAVELLAAAEGADVERVAVVGSRPLAEAGALLSLGFDVVQAVGPRLPGRIEASGRVAPVLPAFFDDMDEREARGAIEAWWARADRPEARPGRLAGTINLDGPGGGGQGRTACWDRVAQLARKGPVTLSGGLRVDNLDRALRAVRPYAVDVCTGVESSPGVKSASALRAFVAEVRRVEAALVREGAA